MIDLQRLKEKLVKACKILFLTGMEDGPHGHISVRVPGKDKILIPAHTHTAGRSLGDIGLEDIITLDFKGKKLDGTGSPPDEAVIHTAIYRARGDVSGVAHVHPLTATAFSTVDKEILPLLSRFTMFAKGVPILDIGPSLIVSEEDGSALVAKLSDRKAVLLRGHGVVVVGESVEEACINTVILERLAKMQLVASLIGTPKPFPEKELLRRAADSEIVFHMWKFFVRQLEKTA